MLNPIKIFKDWYLLELKNSSDQIPSACCLSTNGLDGYPNSRFVSLKDVIDDKFVITGSLNSRKGQELNREPKAALTFWWTATKRQVRIQGNIVRIEDELADNYFANRNKASQIVSQISNQGDEIKDLQGLKDLFETELQKQLLTKIKRPINWSGFYVQPFRIELMTFKENRFHNRELYQKVKGEWVKTILQP